MGTPFKQFIEPSQLDGFQRGAPLAAQPQTVPAAFLDAMKIREKVFVEEQQIPVKREFDADDPRCCHWVLYASVRKISQQEIRDESGNVTQPQKSETVSEPIGTIRLVPFPHEPHPEKGGRYWNGVLEGDVVEKKTGQGPEVAPPKTFDMHRATTFHNGQEPYIKLGRLAVLKEYRNLRFSNIDTQLVNMAIGWLKSHPTYFNPSVGTLGLKQMGATTEKEIPRWNGLVCVHTRMENIKFWEGWGFQVDEEMGQWSEDGMPYVGMFVRLEDKPLT